MFWVILAKDKCRKQESELQCDGLSSAFTIKKKKLTPSCCVPTYTENCKELKNL